MDSLASSRHDPSPLRSRPRRSHLAPDYQDHDPESRAASGRRRSSNRVKACPANPAVINSILDSLEAPEAHSDTGGASSRARSAESPSHRARSVMCSVSPGFGVEYGKGPIYDEEDDDETSTAAAPPTVQTARQPSGLTKYHAQRVASFTNELPRPDSQAAPAPSIRSRRSSVSVEGHGRGHGGRQLSAESWVKHNLISRESVETNKSKSSRRSLRRVTSREELRATSQLEPPADEEDEGAAEPPTISRKVGVKSRAEQIIADAKTSAVPLGKPRLYLSESSYPDESSSKPQSPVVSPGSPTMWGTDAWPMESPGRSIDRSPGPAQQPTPECEAEQSTTSLRKSSPMVDSVPLRTSSLRQSRRPWPKSKERKKSKRDGSEVGSKTGGSPQENPWTELGEEDETVRRIRELQEQHKTRQQRSDATGSPTKATLSEEDKTIPSTRTGPGHTTPLPRVSRADVPSRTASSRGTDSSRMCGEASPKARRVLGLDCKGSTLPRTQPRMQPWTIFSRTKTDEQIKEALALAKPAYDPEMLRPLQRPIMPDSHLRPSTAHSTMSAYTPAISLDYSYAQAIDALQGAERECALRDMPARTLSMSASPLGAGSRPGTAPRPPSQSRWTLNPPSLPTPPRRQRSNRRKSMGDGRRARPTEYGSEALPPRDSIGLAVLEYLHHERLSRKIRHPQTGRVISFSDVGDPQGDVVLVCLGMGLTRYVSAFFDELATTLHLRLITLDRPGVGSSDAYPPTDRSGPLNWSDDVLTLCQELRIERFTLLAHSAGAIYALATALVMPQYVVGKVHLLAPWIPPSQLLASGAHPTTSPSPAAALPRSQRFLRVLPAPLLKAANSSFMTATSASLKPTTTKIRKSSGAKLDGATAEGPSSPIQRSASESHAHESSGPSLDPERRASAALNKPFALAMDHRRPVDGDVTPTSPPPMHIMSAATVAEPTPLCSTTTASTNPAQEEARQQEFTSRLTQQTWELATRDSHPATDLVVCLERHRAVGFRYTDVPCVVAVTHGAEDRRVPLANVQWLAGQMNAAAAARRAGYAGLRPGTMDEREKAAGHGGGGCAVRVLEGEGHGLMASPVIMGDVLTQIAAELAEARRGGNVEGV